MSTIWESEDEPFALDDDSERDGDEAVHSYSFRKDGKHVVSLTAFDMQELRDAITRTLEWWR